MIELILTVGLVITGGLAGYFRISAVRNKSVADFMERRAQSAEAQADALAKIEQARHQARQAGHAELAKMYQILGMGQRHQLGKSHE